LEGGRVEGGGREEESGGKQNRESERRDSNSGRWTGGRPWIGVDMKDNMSPKDIV
jgi:hypothetical protein